MSGWVKKTAIVLGIIASTLFIGKTVKGWVDEKKTDTTTTTESAQVQVVDYVF